VNAKWPQEARVLVNGIWLTEAQSMALRVAVGMFLSDLADADRMKSLGDIGPLYQARLHEVQDLLSSKERA